MKTETKKKIKLKQKFWAKNVAIAWKWPWWHR